MGTGLTVAAVLAWDPSALAQDADRLRRASDRLGEITEELAHSRKGLAGDWLGPAGEEAQRRFADQVEHGTQLSRVVRDAERALESGAHRLRGVRDRLRSAVTAAEQDGCTVRDDGSVQPPPVPATTWPDGTPAAEADRLQRQHEERVAQAQGLAERHATAVRGALDDARLADEEVAEELRSVQLPDGMAAELAEASRATSGTVVFPAGWSPMEAFRPGGIEEWTTAVSTGAKSWVSAHLASNRAAVNESTGYFGGGFIEGPDGRSYPLVVPRLVEDGESYGANMNPMGNGPENLGGRDTGWRTIGQQAGYDQLESVSESDQTWATLGAAAGGSMKPAGDLVRRQDLEHGLAIGPSGYPSLRPEDQQSSTSPVQPPPGTPATGSQMPGHNPERAGRMGGALDLATNAVEGVQAAQRIENAADHPYVLSLQEHEDGRRRAIMNIYNVFEDKQTGDSVLQSNHGWVNERGELTMETFSFRKPEHGVISAPGVSHDQWP